MLEITIAGNVEACRTEAHVADESGSSVAIVYEDSDGWHSEVVDRLEESSGSFNAVVENAKEALYQYVNRRGDNVPAN